ncbi:MAG: hypothetical protein A2821_03535 [Candidatus Magasanikbacteria bacterium RIFCSPHIGHO2_01_FULL_41_23]|uniref:Peptidase S8/S53 domain-containing protein n=1 Tax=Candidatus Magasanikbacteria bacterium RIFCSPLOWO2_01_FULL_40_15 TaxID=1798686 RepID=A0A1F6N1J1_9BACT|nr:MAG: hypothetical protein A2821_03535 [Candidatus Magasanikbacteria bacterium RIFCSPHIGHO2_01_FULL_41_23]OGH66623.1 MAG: hypothetical protein A3C66_03115 [Candidatus Magasanikbacteria bacterium RIFCSPHIGHO2_02_FULL_41_35]OGH74776.1 MAG: hypothetical protein A3F22_00900 [Candidatus Magasanikbacteria bacterium RIFCSPHIGHO2_12_FULL_41_16]OGH77752.1 MAG: hypothetical protein A2983_03875 [Candidatus Magasanikbacteria bacterium RIFCSPLOWO2_01_FULL_40_15]
MKQSFFIKSISLISLVFLGFPLLAWALTSNDPKSFQTAYEQTGVYRAWDYSTGSADVIVAVIDNGFDTFHPDLQQNVWKNTKEIPDNKIDDDHNGYVDDVWGWSFLDGTNNPQPSVANLTAEEKKDGLFSHGTFVAGVIGAVGNNNRDGVGINWRVKLMNIRVLGNNGYGELAPLGKAIRYAVDNGAQVINVSMVGDKDENTASAVKYAYEKGVVVVAAMGNYNGNLNNNLMYPACADADTGLTMVLGVSAVNAERRLASFSNTGSKCVDITAPGVDIGSTVRYSPNDGLSETYVRGWQGTSFATPFVSGAAALVKSIRPEWKAPQIYEALLSTTHHTPANDEAAYAQSYGRGLLQVHRAVAYAMGLTIPPTMFETSTTNIVSTTMFAVLPKNQKTFSVIWPNSELRDGYADNSELGAIYERPEAKNIESITAVGVGRDQKIITARPKNKTERQITVYNYRWQEESNWNVSAKGSVNVSAIWRESGLTIGVAPTTADTQIYWLYDSAGNVLESKAQKIMHNGARVLVGATDVYAVVGHSAKNKQTINIFNYKDGQIITEFTADEYTALQNTPIVPTAALGDVVGNSEPEIILGSALGANDMITIYSANGSLVRSFAPFGNGAGLGATVSLFDADGNGSLDIVTGSVIKPTTLRAWSGRAKLVAEWSVQNVFKNFFLLPRK